MSKGSTKIFLGHKATQAKKMSSRIKGTVSVISSDPPCKDGNGRITTVPCLESFVWSSMNQCFCFFKLFFFHLSFPWEIDLRISCLFLSSFPDCSMATPPLTLIISLPRLIPCLLNKSLYLTDLLITWG